jgi:predicted TIM-barrel fold metal-dependent hydrolase
MKHELEGVDDAVNRWRLETPGSKGWEGSPRPGAPNKYVMFSADSHVSEPATLWKEQIDKKYVDRLPRMSVEDDPVEKGKRIQVIHQEGFRPTKTALGEEAGPIDRYMEKAARTLEQRIIDEDFDGIDAELVYGNKVQLAFATNDAEFALAQTRIYVDWVRQFFAGHEDRFMPAAPVPTLDIDLAIKELHRVAATGWFKAIQIPVKPAFGPEKHGDPNYNLPEYDRFWAAVAETNLRLIIHVGTGRDPRIASKNGGAMINMVWGSHAYAMSASTYFLSSGIFDRFPTLKLGFIEAGCGWVSYITDYLDQSYKKHHMWVRPKLKHGLPTDYFKAHCFASFEEDRAGMAVVEQHGFEDNFMWGNDYPHYEGTWPNSAEAIEREMGHLKESTRRKLLAKNAERFLGVKVMRRKDRTQFERDRAYA